MTVDLIFSELQAALAFVTVLIISFMAIGIFKKNMFQSFAVFFLCIADIYIYFLLEYEGFTYVMVALLAVAGYELWQMTKMRK